MPSYYILHHFTEIDLDRALEEVNQLPLQRYYNPFERKSFLASKADMLDSPSLCYCLDELRGSIKVASQLLNLPLYVVDWQHYGGLFVYRPGDYLAPHVDAGIHPRTGARKLATVVLYLTDATLSFWQGDSCLENTPEVWLEQSVGLRAGDAIVFANHDSDWHSVPVVHSPEPRVCMTLSYMAYPGFKHSHYTNPRTRAYFAKRHGVPDTPEIAALRIARASEEEHERVYRWTGNTK